LEFPPKIFNLDSNLVPAGGIFYTDPLVFLKTAPERGAVVVELQQGLLFFRGKHKFNVSFGTSSRKAESEKTGVLQ
jgi:hypothetical protein